MITESASTKELIDRLASHRTIGAAPREELTWIATHGTLRHYDQGEVVARHTEPVDGLHILLTGRIAIYMNRGTGMRRMMAWEGGEVSGMLPYSRLTTPPGDTIVEEPTESFMITRDQLPELIRNCYETTAMLVHVMTDRARRFTSTDLRDEKMISLGKLAAGFAHEVNNPASAALRDANALANALSVAEEAARTLFAAGLSGPQLAELNAFWKKTKDSPKQQSMSGLELTDREDAIAEWLQKHNIPETLAEELARTQAETGDLDSLGKAIVGANLESALHWLTAALSARSLVDNIDRAARRIHTLVAAAKGFTHMDRSPDLEPVDIASGLIDTVTLLQGKARSKSVAIAVNIPNDLPLIRGHGAEINQIWMNLLDNAIDAAPNNGHVSVTAIAEIADVIVSVTDDGAGIPPEIKEHIFDPFFTTKAVGEGTGLGLDIVRRVVHWHNGDVSGDSQRGRTEFRVRLPVVGPQTRSETEAHTA